MHQTELRDCIIIIIIDGAGCEVMHAPLETDISEQLALASTAALVLVHPGEETCMAKQTRVSGCPPGDRHRLVGRSASRKMQRVHAHLLLSLRLVVDHAALSTQRKIHEGGTIIVVSGMRMALCRSEQDGIYPSLETMPARRPANTVVQREYARARMRALCVCRLLCP